MLPGGDTFAQVGQTTGRGRLDRRYDQEGTVRQVFVYPLERNWRQSLMAEEPAGKFRTEEKEHIERSVSAGRDEGMITAEQRLNEMNEERIRQRYEILAPFLDEKQRRLFAGAKGQAPTAPGARNGSPGCLACQT